jgi:hypothetical protein
MLQPNSPSASFSGGIKMPAAMLMELPTTWTMASIATMIQL